MKLEITSTGEVHMLNGTLTRLWTCSLPPGHVVRVYVAAVEVPTAAAEQFSGLQQLPFVLIDDRFEVCI